MLIGVKMLTPLTYIAHFKRVNGTSELDLCSFISCTPCFVVFYLASDLGRIGEPVGYLSSSLSDVVQPSGERASVSAHYDACLPLCESVGDKI